MTASAAKPRRILSPLSLRIMAVNVIALGILGGGVLYLNQFRDALVERRIEELRGQTRIIAGALGEAATGGPENEMINVPAARQVLGRLVGKSRLRARLFSTDGELLADSRFMFLGQSVIAEELPPPNVKPNWRRRVAVWVDELLDQLIDTPRMEPYQERAPQRASDYPELAAAMSGQEANYQRSLEDGAILITATAPVQRFRRVLGGLLVSTDTRDIDALVRRERYTILQVFGASLAVTLLLSFFLAGTIARPIRRLAAAADRVRGGLGREVQLPDYVDRGDEIGDLTRSIADMTRALNRQIDAVESFAADVAHEIKNPLSSIRSAIETLARTDDVELQSRLLAIIKEDVKRLDRLITDISDASRLDAELSRGKMEKVDLAKLVSNLVEVYRATAKTGGARPVFDEPLGSVFVAGIEGRLGQVLRNIIENAMSFSPADGVIRITLTAKDGKALLMVDDDGPGLPHDNVTDIFRRFYSERPAGEAFGTHSGLGLSISKQIVEAHGGNIYAQNRREGDHTVGARFFVELPLSR